MQKDTGNCQISREYRTMTDGFDWLAAITAFDDCVDADNIFNDDDDTDDGSDDDETYTGEN
jgi:hypothetical protein